MLKLEVVIVPVTEVNRAKQFYKRWPSERTSMSLATAVTGLCR